MTDPRHIPHLIKLIDDESELVRTQVIRELAAFGPNLKEELRKLKVVYSLSQKEYIESILKCQKLQELKHLWSNWFYVKDDYARLEMGLTMLSNYLSGGKEPTTVKELLDDLAFTYQETHRRKDARLLARFLFEEKGLKGEEEDYYNPQNCNLINVIEDKKGIPISLVCVYMLVGHRLGLHIEGCNFPGHFLGKVKYRGQVLFVDCFSGGQFIAKEDLMQVKEELLGDMRNILSETTDVDSIIRRYLANLIRSFQIEEDDLNNDFMISLFKDIDNQNMIKRMSAITPDEIIQERTPILNAGMIIRHVRYGYRGIIVDIDPQCCASDNWYYSNQTQPDRDQPWYHVLVHGSDQVTYVAENNLFLEPSEGQIVHPLVNYFFSRQKSGKYIRNDNPWPDDELESDGE